MRDSGSVDNNITPLEKDKEKTRTQAEGLIPQRTIFMSNATRITTSELRIPSTRIGYVVLMLALLVMILRDSIAVIPGAEDLGLFKYLMAVVIVIILVPNLFVAWRSSTQMQQRFVVVVSLIVVLGIWSAIVNEDTTQLNYLFYLAEWGILLISTVILIKNREQATFFLRGYLLFSLVAIFAGFAQGLNTLTEIDVSLSVESDRFVGVGFDPNYFVMTVIFPLAYVFALISDNTCRLRSRLIYACVAAVIIVAVIWSGSRSGAISVAVLLILLGILRGPRSLMKLLFFSFIGLGAITVIIGFDNLMVLMSQMITRWELAGNTISRPDIWAASVGNIAARPILGWGPGSLSNLLSSGIYIGIGGYIKPHNAWIVAGIERGLFGMALEMLLIVFGLKASAGLCRSGDHTVQTMGIALVSGIVALGVMTLTLGGMPYAIHLLCAISIALAATQPFLR